MRERESEGLEETRHKERESWTDSQAERRDRENTLFLPSADDLWLSAATSVVRHLSVLEELTGTRSAG